MTPARTAPPSGAPRLLLVDDDATFGAVMARVLARRGFEVTHASDLAAARAALSAAVPDYALV
ncbi:MAG TPA: two-component system response regulator, partial [Gammaproteobacteria bacterium]|nr:two-component system response regulator [Gammaproteobacteria bacterium]